MKSMKLYTFLWVATRWSKAVSQRSKRISNQTEEDRMAKIKDLGYGHGEHVDPKHRPTKIQSRTSILW
jgi:hypothetical protein